MTVNFWELMSRHTWLIRTQSVGPQDPLYPVRKSWEMAMAGQFETGCLCGVYPCGKFKSENHKYAFVRLGNDSWPSFVLRSLPLSWFGRLNRSSDKYASQVKLPKSYTGSRPDPTPRLHKELVNGWLTESKFVNNWKAMVSNSCWCSLWTCTGRPRLKWYRWRVMTT